MLYQDKVYGEIDISNNVIQELIATEPFQRLKRISQDGATHLIQPVRSITRYEHSLGVWYLSQYFKRPLEEQIASLLHDLSHTAFSHVIDFVVGNHGQDFADEKLEEMILASEIPAILERNGLDIHKVLNKEDFPLLDNSLPGLSIDRLDYCLRDAFTLGFLPNETMWQIINGLKLENDELYFEDPKLAALLATLFISYSRLLWSDPVGVGSYMILAEAIKQALKKNIVTEKDFFTDDDTLYAMLKSSGDAEINTLLTRLTPGHDFVFCAPEDAEFTTNTKVRYIDPLVKTPTGLVRVSEITISLKTYFQEFVERYKFLAVREVTG